MRFVKVKSPAGPIAFAHFKQTLERRRSLINNSERPVDALAENINYLLTTWNQEMLAHLKTTAISISKRDKK